MDQRQDKATNKEMGSKKNTFKVALVLLSDGSRVEEENLIEAVSEE